MTTLNQLKNVVKRKKVQRVGRGPGSGRGKTSSRGHKGYGSRGGSTLRLGNEGGQTPLFTRFSTRGFSNARFKKRYALVNLYRIETLFSEGDEVNLETLQKKGVVKRSLKLLKIAGKGELKKKVKILAHAYTKGAMKALEKEAISFEILSTSKQEEKK